MADLWVRGCGREQYVKIEGGIDLSSERPDPVPTFADVARVSSDWLLRYQVWIDNWLQINPYLVANARTSTSIACRSSSSSMSSVAPSWVGPWCCRLNTTAATSCARFSKPSPCSPWHLTQHSVRLRQEIMRLRRQRKLHFTDGDDPRPGVPGLQAQASHQAARPRRSHGSFHHTVAGSTSPPSSPTHPCSATSDHKVSHLPSPQSHIYFRGHLRPALQLLRQRKRRERMTGKVSNAKTSAPTARTGC